MSPVLTRSSGRFNTRSSVIRVSIYCTTTSVLPSGADRLNWTMPLSSARWTLTWARFTVPSGLRGNTGSAVLWIDRFREFDLYPSVAACGRSARVICMQKRSLLMKKRIPKCRCGAFRQSRGFYALRLIGVSSRSDLNSRRNSLS